MSTLSVSVESIAHYVREHVLLSCFAVFAVYSVLSWSWQQWTQVPAEYVMVELMGRESSRESMFQIQLGSIDGQTSFAC